MFAGGENPDWKWRPEKSIKLLMIGPTINYEAAAAAATSVELIAQKKTILKMLSFISSR